MCTCENKVFASSEKMAKTRLQVGREHSMGSLLTIQRYQGCKLHFFCEHNLYQMAKPT